MSQTPLQSLWNHLLIFVRWVCPEKAEEVARLGKRLKWLQWLDPLQDSHWYAAEVSQPYPVYWLRKSKWWVFIHELDLLDTPLFSASVRDRRIFAYSLLRSASHTVRRLEDVVLLEISILPWTFAITFLSRRTTVETCCAMQLMAFGRYRSDRAAYLLWRLQWLVFSHFLRW